MSNILATLQAHTNFLDSPRIRASTAYSDFQFGDLKKRPITVSLVLPADRLDTYDRWLRLLIQLAITVNARNIQERPEKPVLFLLDELATLGRLSAVQKGWTLMAGFSMLFYGVIQDLTQLEEHWGNAWQTFIGNSGSLIYLGSRDLKTAEYFSKLCGVTTVEKFSFTHALSTMLSYARTMAFGKNASDSSTTTQGSSESESTTADVAQRSLAYPDELMVMKGAQQLLIIDNHNPIMCERIPWFENDELMQLGVNLRRRRVGENLCPFWPRRSTSCQ